VLTHSCQISTRLGWGFAWTRYPDWIFVEFSASAPVEDVPLLLGHFFPDMPPSEREALAVQVQDRRWPGNLRELRNFAERVRAPFGSRRSPIGLIAGMRISNDPGFREPPRRLTRGRSRALLTQRFLIASARRGTRSRFRHAPC
jgi:hypothetical protein